jgi:hypothetical protein
LGRRAVTIARVRGGMSAAGSTRLRSRISRRAYRRLARLRSARLVLVTRAVDPAGNAAGARRRVVVRR